MILSNYVNTFGQDLLRRYGERVHKLAIHAGFTCPNRDGTKGRGGCTFCNNHSFSPNARETRHVTEQLESGRRVLKRRTGARKFIAYFQAYTNTYADLSYLRPRYEAALDQPDVVGLAVGTRPDCVPDPVLDLLAGYRDRGLEVWLELGLQSASDRTLQRVNRGHGFGEYQDAVTRARQRGLSVCTHLIVGLPGEGRTQALQSLARVLELGTQGLKLHPLHVVKGTLMANQWRRGEYRAMELDEYAALAADMIEATPDSVVFHRISASASPRLLLAPAWCAKKWPALNALTSEMARRRGALKTGRIRDA